MMGLEALMIRAAAVALALASSTVLLAQEKPKPVPKDSQRVAIPGCTKGYVFTVGRRTADQPGTADLPEGLHLRMNGDKKLMSDIKAHEGAMVEITGIMKKSDFVQDGIAVGGLRIAPSRGTGGSVSSNSIGSQIPIDVESWRQIPGGCPVR